MNAEQLERSLLDDADRAELAGLLGERAAFDAPLAPLCSWKIGGPADALVYLESAAELAAVLRLVFRRKLPWFVLGSGSNLLVGDGGMRGIVVRLGGAFARDRVRRRGRPGGRARRCVRVARAADGAVCARAGRSASTGSPGSRGASVERCG